MLVAAALTRCSQLSITRRVERDEIAVITAAWSPPAASTAAAISPSTRLSWLSGERSTHLVRPKRVAPDATVRASRVLPTPPGPTTVTSRCPASSPRLGHLVVTADESRHRLGQPDIAGKLRSRLADPGSNLGAIVEAELVADLLDVPLDRALRDEEPLADFSA